MAEEVKIVNDSLMCFSHSSVQGRIKNAEFFNKSFSLKTVICPWKILEKSVKFVSEVVRTMGWGEERGCLPLSELASQTSGECHF